MITFNEKVLNQYISSTIESIKNRLINLKEEDLEESPFEDEEFGCLILETISSGFRRYDSVSVSTCCYQYSRDLYSVDGLNIK